MSPGPLCNEALIKLQTFLDRELSDNEISEVHFHLDRCPPCQHVFRFEERLRRLVKTRCLSDCAPESLRDQILSRVREARK